MVACLVGRETREATSRVQRGRARVSECHMVPGAISKTRTRRTLAESVLRPSASWLDSRLGLRRECRSTVFLRGRGAKKRCARGYHREPVTAGSTSIVIRVLSQSECHRSTSTTGSGTVAGDRGLVGRSLRLADSADTCTGNQIRNGRNCGKPDDYHYGSQKNCGNSISRVSR